MVRSYILQCTKRHERKPRMHQWRLLVSVQGLYAFFKLVHYGIPIQLVVLGSIPFCQCCLNKLNFKICHIQGSFNATLFKTFYLCINATNDKETLFWRSDLKLQNTKEIHGLALSFIKSPIKRSHQLGHNFLLPLLTKISGKIA